MHSHGHNEDKYNLFFIIFYSIYKNNAAQYKELEQQALKSRHSKKNTEKYHLLTTFKGGVILLTIFFAPLHFIHFN